MSLKRSELFFLAILVPIDSLMIFMAFLAAYFLRAEQAFLPAVYMMPIKQFLLWSFLIIPLWVLIFALSGLYSYKKVIQTSLLREFANVFIAVTAGMMIVVGYLFLTKTAFFSRLVIIYLWVIACIFVIIGRSFIHYFRKWLLKKRIGVHRVIIVGYNKSSRALIEQIRKASDFRIVGIVGKKDKKMHVRFYPNIEVLQKVKGDFCDDIILATSKISQKEVAELIDFCYDRHFNFKFAPELYKISAEKIEQMQIGKIPLLELKKTPLDGWGRIVKRLVDILGSFLLIILFSPVMLIMAIAIKLDSKGTVFFTYKRVGRAGQLFTFRKFRSMYPGVHHLRFDKKFRKKFGDLRAGTPMIKIKNDPRITRVGRFIRRTHLDELAQLFSVLSGSMSLVGPRPHEIEEVAKYQKHHRKVLTIKPGITGVAQISGASDLDFEDEVKLDTEYIQNWSLWKDIIILLKTPLAFLRPPKAE